MRDNWPDNGSRLPKHLPESDVASAPKPCTPSDAVMFRATHLAALSMMCYVSVVLSLVVTLAALKRIVELTHLPGDPSLALVLVAWLGIVAIGWNLVWGLTSAKPASAVGCMRLKACGVIAALVHFGVAICIL